MLQTREHRYIAGLAQCVDQMPVVIFHLKSAMR